MAKARARAAEPVVEEEEAEAEVVEETEESTGEEIFLYRVMFRRALPTGKELASRVKTFITFGTNETDAIGRVWEAYRGSTFQKEFNPDLASAELILGKVLRAGG